MSEEVKAVNQDDKKQSESAIDNSTADNQVDKKSNMIPQARFDEVNSKYKTLQERFDQMNDTIKQQEQQKEIQAGNLEKVIEKQNLELKELTGKLETTSKSYTALESSVKKEYLDHIPEDKREKYQDYPIDAIQDIAEVFKGSQGNNVKVDTSNPTRRPSGEFGGYESYVEWATKDPEGYKKANNEATSGKIKIGY